MENSRRSIAFKSLYVVRFVLEMAGVLLVIFALFFALLVHTMRTGAHYPHSFQRGLAITIFMFFDGVSFLWPKVEVKVLASLFLALAGGWTFFHDAYKWDNLGIFALLLLPLPLTFWLWAGYRKFEIERLPSGNWLP